MLGPISQPLILRKLVAHTLDYVAQFAQDRCELLFYYLYVADYVDELCEFLNKENRPLRQLVAWRRSGASAPRRRGAPTTARSSCTWC